MIPVSACEITRSLPDHELWLPSAEELENEEGFGPFRDTWVIRDIPLDIARDMVDEEALVIGCVDALTATAAEFDALLGAIESDDISSLPDAVRQTVASSDVLFSLLGRELAPGAGLDLGIAGLVYALAATGSFPAASCRGHSGDLPWSEFPIVRLSATLETAGYLLDVAADIGCGIMYEEPLLTIWAPSVLEVMRMASSLLEAAGA